jgi:hypothetical protein
MKPPSLHTLLEDPLFRAYMKQVPDLSPNLAHGSPWAVWARTTDEPARWRGGKFTTYRDAWTATVKAVRNTDRYQDVALVSLRQFFPPPEGFHWDYNFEWCSRCRRPSYFAYRPRHHALRNAPVLTSEDALRCFYCGVRHCAMPAYHH